MDSQLKAHLESARIRLLQAEVRYDAWASVCSDEVMLEELGAEIIAAEQEVSEIEQKISDKKS